MNSRRLTASLSLLETAPYHIVEWGRILHHSKFDSLMAGQGLDSAILGTLALKKRLVLNAPCRRLLGTLRGKKTCDISKWLNSERFRTGSRDDLSAAVRQPVPPSANDLHPLARLALRRDAGGLLLAASSLSIAARIHSRAMSNSFSRSSGLLACLASLTQSRANSSNSDPDDMGAPPVKVPFVAFE
jgi:hypothetical protein